MSTNVSMPASPSPSIDLSAILAIPVTNLMISTILGSMLIPILFALFLFSTPSLRRSAVFVLNVIGLLLGIVEAIFEARNDIFLILSPTSSETGGEYIASTVLIAVGTILVDSILLLRLMVVYPFHRTPRKVWLAIVSFPVAIKVLRVVNISVYCASIAQVINNDSPLEASAALENLFNARLEWTAQLLDNAFMSTVFLWRLHSHNKQTIAIRSDLSPRSFSSRLGDLMCIAVLNFVFPVMLNLAQFIVGYGAADFTSATYIIQVNFHVTIIGVVFATVWVSYTKWSDEQTINGPSSGFSTLAFAPQPRYPAGVADVHNLGGRRSRLPVMSLGQSFGFTSNDERQGNSDAISLEISAKDGDTRTAVEQDLEAKQ